MNPADPFPLKSLPVLALVVMPFMGGAQTFLATDGAAFETCSGVFYDSGGSAGDYASGEVITTTICPAGGAGSGPLTSIAFTQWSLAPGPGDSLFIHDGTDITGPLLASGTGAISLFGQSFQAASASGCLTFRWVSDGVGTAAGWAARITTGPDAGTNTSKSVCTTHASFILFDHLGGTPEAGGSWTAPGGGAHGGTFDPATDPPGTYTYTVSGPAPCPDSSATLTVTVVQPPNAGADSSIVVCTNAPSFNMRLRLAGSPTPGGSWTDPGGATHPNFFNPSSSAPGTYTYTLGGQGVCPDATARLTIAMVTARNAGTSSTLALCSDGLVTPLIGALGGSPEPGGTWAGPGGPHSGDFNPATDPPGAYTYTLIGTFPCPNGTATVTVEVNQRPDAGQNGNATVCSDGASFNLVSVLGGSPDGGGTWTGPGGAAVPGTYTPGTSVPGTYTYTVLGAPPCAPSSATATITEVPAPNAGMDHAITVCGGDGVFAMRPRLNGNPQSGGTWSGPNGVHGPDFNPATDPPGAYTYTVRGTSPCLDASATLTITVREEPDAGTNGGTTVCSTSGSFQLFGLLGGSPDLGGLWTRPDGQPHSGTFTPGTSLPGTYTYTVTGLAPCTPSTATVTVTVNQAPSAGTNATVTRCTDAATFSLFTLLGGTPSPGGSWTGPNGTHGDTFNPASDTPGAYTYTVMGVPPCLDASAVVTVWLVSAPNAGDDATTTVCGNGTAFDLFALLGGQPDVTGTWAGPDGSPHNGIFTPGASQPGEYIYTVPGQGDCVDDRSKVTVNVVPAPNAGTNGSLTVCSNAAPVDLFTRLGGTPDPNGTWTRPSGTPHSGIYMPATQNPGTFTYTVAGTPPCGNASASVQVVRVIAPNPGTDGSITVCDTDAPFDLVSVLGGNPTGGTWYNPLGVQVSSTFVPGSSLPGTYMYVTLGTAPCANDTAYATVNVNVAPDAGEDAALTVCSTSGPIALFGVLNGTPAPGGAWTDPSGQPFPSGTYTPGSSSAGTYTYALTGQAPCPNASAVVVVSEVRQPVAGANASFERCSTDGALDLFTKIGGTPDAGGTWTGPGGGSVSNVFDPATSPSGTYTYTVVGAFPCTNAQASVTATVHPAPNAGTSGSVTVCEGTPNVDLFSGLGGSPGFQGVWTDDDNTGQLSGNFFITQNMAAGDYDFTYTVAAIGQCPAASATVRVTIAPAFGAGGDGSISVCNTNTQLDLFTVLTGSPQPGGTWTAIDAVPPGALSGRFLNTTILGAGTYRFRYDLTGSGDCLSASALATVTVVARPNAGGNGGTTVCGNGQAFDLFSLLSGNPQSPGAWTRDGQPVPSGYNPVNNGPGSAVFIYTVTGSGACAGVTATASVTVTNVQPPNPGRDTTITVCSSAGPFPMTPLMGGQPGGRWYFGTTLRSDDVFRPWMDLPGAYVYTVDGSPPCGPVSATLTVNVVAKRNAGRNNSLTVCSTDNPFSLFFLLGDSAQVGGTWRGPDGLVHPNSHAYYPGSSPPGDYWHRIPASGPCRADSALVTIYEEVAPNAGTSVGITLCKLPGTLNLFFLLEGNPDPGGTWIDPAGNPFQGVFDRMTGLPGVYRYTVAGAPPCSSASSTVTVTVNVPANAGSSNAITVCDSDPAFAMTSRLLGTPAAGGVWTGPAPGTDPHPGTFIPGNATYGAPGLYTYTVPGAAPCPNATATLSITVRPARYAGENVTVTLCGNSAPQNLFQRLGSGAQTGGTWTGPDGQGHSGVFDPATDPAGVYVYSLIGQEPCANDSARATVVVNQAPNAGCNGQAIICDTDGPFLLINRLGCPAMLNGNWRDPGNNWHSGIFDPRTDIGGLYTYTVTGTPPCASASATVMVIMNKQQNAGEDAVVTICSDSPASVPLFGLLGGTPDTGGSWSPTDTHTPGIPGSYTYWYTVLGVAPCVARSASVRVVERRAPEAGFGTLLTVCSDTADLDLFSLLGGTPDPNGAWTFGGDAHGGVFRPGGPDSPGTYVYRVSGAFPCEDDSAQVRIVVVPGPRAGTDGAITACLGDPSVNLFEAIGPIGSYDDWGSWYSDIQTNPLNNGIFDATDVSAGSYGFRYVVPGIAPCGSASVTVVVTITEALDAGLDSMVVVCEGEQVVLFNMLGGAPQGGGSWLDVDGSNALYIGPNGRRVFNTSLVEADRAWRFDYVLPPSAQCPGDTARVTVNVQRGPNAGCDAILSLCGNDTAPRSLFNKLGCGPDPNGSWFDPLFASHGGTFVAGPGSIPGTYRYVVEGIGECLSDTAAVVVQVTRPPYPGRDTTFSVCSNGVPVDLFERLGAGAEAGGVWTRLSPLPATSSDGIHRPGPQAATYIYRYRLPATGACPVQEARITVTDVPAPNAGCAGAVNRCSTSAPIEMRLFLGCSPTIGGQWTMNGTLHPGDFFAPAEHPPGVYTYTVAGTGPCPAASATLAVSVTRAANPGPNTTVNVCITQDSVDLKRELGLLADDGGIWTVVTLGLPAGAFSNGMFYPPLTGAGTTWRFRYSFPSNGPCLAVFSEMTVLVGQGVSPGQDSIVTVCGADGNFDLFSALGGSPNPGGAWTAQRPEFNALGPTGILDASRLPPGGSPYLFLYTVIDPLCGPATAIVFVTTTPYPDPGVGGTVYFCSTATPVENLFDRLTGTPDGTGSWTGPDGLPHNGVFSDGGGAGQYPYTYTVPGNAACPDSSAVVLVVVNAPPDAGDDGTTLVCDTLTAMPLFPVLGGGPQPGGVWTSLDGPGGLTGGTVNTTLLAGGEHRYRYTVDVPGCGRDSAVVMLTVVSSVVVGEVERVCNSRERTYTVSFTITEGDVGSYSVTGVDGTLSAGPLRVFTSAPIPTSQGFELFVTDANGCGTSRVTGVSPCSFDDDVFVPQSFSPNGDGINDRFIIPGIEGFPGNEIVIFNRWGGKMYEGGGYDNASVVWDGTSPNGFYSGLAPAGTYFYILDLGNGKTPLTGYLQLVR